MEKQWVLHSLSLRNCNLRYPQYAMHVSLFVICDLPHSKIFFHVFSLTAWFSKKSYWTQNVCFDFLYKFFLKNFYSKKKWARYDKNVYWSSRLFLSDLNETWIFPPQIFAKSSTIKFHENPSSEIRVVPYRRTNMTKLIVAFRNFANAPNKE